MVESKLFTKHINFIVYEGKNKTYNLLDYKLFPLKLIIWSPGSKAVDRNMDAFHKNLRLESLNTYTDDSKSDRNIYQETATFSHIIKREIKPFGFLIEVGNFSGLEKLSSKDEDFLNDANGIIFVYDFNYESNERTKQSFQELKKFTKRRKIPYFIQVIGMNKPENEIIETVKRQLISANPKKRKDNNVIIFSIINSNEQGYLDCLDNFLLIAKIL